MFRVFDELVGKVMKEVFDNGDELVFITEDGERYSFYHDQDCCESVYIEDICGDLTDLIGAPIVLAEEVSCEDKGPKSEWDEAYEWTFYKFATSKGYVDVRWYGSSNGYYSIAVKFGRR